MGIDNNYKGTCTTFSANTRNIDCRLSFMNGRFYVMDADNGERIDVTDEVKKSIEKG